MVKKFWRYIYSFRQTDTAWRHRSCLHSIMRQNSKQPINDIKSNKLWTSNPWITPSLTHLHWSNGHLSGEPRSSGCPPNFPSPLLSETVHPPGTNHIFSYSHLPYGPVSHRLPCSILSRWPSWKQNFHSAGWLDSPLSCLMQVGGVVHGVLRAVPHARWGCARGTSRSTPRYIFHCRSWRWIVLSVWGRMPILTPTRGITHSTLFSNFRTPASRLGSSLPSAGCPTAVLITLTGRGQLSVSSGIDVVKVK